MSKQQQHHSHELLDLVLVGGAAAIIYLWVKGEPAVPDAPAGSSIPVQADVQVNRVKAGWLSLFPSTTPTLPASTDSTPVVVTDPIAATTTLPPVTTQQSCLGGIGSIKNQTGIYTPAKGDDIGTQSMLTTSLTAKNLPASPEQIAAEAVTAKKPTLITCS